MWRIYPYAAPEQDPARQMPAFQVKTRYKLIYMQNRRVDSGRPLVWGSGANGHPICPAYVDQNIEAELPWLPICGQPAVQGEKDYLCAYHDAMARHGGGVRHLIDMRQINVNYTQPRWLREWRWPE